MNAKASVTIGARAHYGVKCLAYSSPAKVMHTYHAVDGTQIQRRRQCLFNPKTFVTPSSEQPKPDDAAAIELLKEARESIAACFRVISQTTTDQTIIARLEFELTLAGVRDGIGVRLQDFIAANVRMREGANNDSPVARCDG